MSLEPVIENKNLWHKDEASFYYFLEVLTQKRLDSISSSKREVEPPQQ